MKTSSLKNPGIAAKFFQVDGKLRCEVTNMTDQRQPTVIYKKVSPELIAQFEREYDAFSKGRDSVDYGGTSLTEIPGIDEKMAFSCKLNGIHNAEMLAEASDAHCAQIGGLITARKGAVMLLENKKMQAELAVIAAAKAAGIVAVTAAGAAVAAAQPAARPTVSLPARP